MDDAIEVLEDLKKKTAAQDWVVPSMKRAVIAGIALCIEQLKVERMSRIDAERAKNDD